MANAPLPTPEELRQLLEYNPDTGSLIWRERPLALFVARGGKHPHRTCAKWNAQFAGKEAFIGLDGGGYRQGTIFRRYFKANRVAWAIHHGVWPTHQIGHADGDASNIRINNLSDVPHVQVQRNCRLSKANRSGVPGVSWNKVHGKWQAFIGENGRTKSLGAFARLEDAAAARKQAERELGYHTRHGERREKTNKFVPAKDR
ncbi:hypothetical protein HNO88_002934 [Novosphingobium chloroacetimidivorans]|uniref:HNH nuclease domain-containing protein n=1 Tax=Novosphingobium chloroacetimidivorans TaxID=1428314 RepID=A0A7W7KBM7_9SPHN|nr:HNH endonuclease [Novosphingobium chloroacetimidivorans]MBB4859605.1 hypothetical protein [Novosphingobium chloroacetimidivorans]